MEPEVHNRAPEAVKDEPAIKEVINRVKSQGLFDQFRKECIADVDTKPAYHNLLQRVESYVEHFLQGQKWSLSANKNQLRETLRRQLHNSGMMQNGVERIIEQVVNPKILLGIKPKIDEAVCDHLGIDLKARQEEQQRRKQERQKLLIQQIQQQQLQSVQSQNVKNEETFKAGGAAVPPIGSSPWMPGMANFPSPSVPGAHVPAAPGVPGNPQTMGGNFPGMVPPFSLMGGWVPGFNPGIPPMMPGQPMIPAFPGPTAVSPIAGMGPRPPFNSTTPVTPASSKPLVTSPQSSLAVTASTPVIPDLTKPPPGLPGTPTPAGSLVAPAPPGSIPPPPGTVPIVRPESSSLSANLPGKTNPPLHTSAAIPALLSHTLAKVSQDELTPEKIAVFKTAAAFITKTVNNAQGTAGADLSSIFSPRVLAEAMMEDCGKPMTKHEIRAAKRKERIRENERLRAQKEEKEFLETRDKTRNEGDKENPLPPQHNLMDVFQGAEDVSDDEEALDLLMDMDEKEEQEDRNKRGVVLSDDSDKEGDKPPTSQPGKRYNFAWDVDANSDNMSDVTVSSVHTSDMSSFEEDEDEDFEVEETCLDSTREEEAKAAEVPELSRDSLTEVKEEPKEEGQLDSEEILVDSGEVKVEGMEKEEDSKPAPEAKPLAADVKPKQEGESKVVETAVPVSDTAVEAAPKVEEDATKATEVVQPKRRKLVALSYNYSGSEDEETREERKARIAREKEERYLKRQQRRAELDAKKKERDEERARQRKEKQIQKEKSAEDIQDNKLDSVTGTSQTDTLNTTNTSFEAESSSQATPKKRKNKAEMKEQLLQQKVMEKKAALRRKRTRNRRYASDEFTSIFSRHKKLNQSYTSDNMNPEEIVTFEGDGALEIVEMTVDQECVVETVGEEVETNNVGSFGNESLDNYPSDKNGQTGELVLQCRSPYSDISDRSMSERSEPEQVSDPGMDEVSDDELGDLEEVKIVEEMEDSSKGPLSPSQSASESDVGHVSEAMTPDTTKMSSTKSKSIVSQDDVESISSQSVEKEKSGKKSDPASAQEEDVESQASLMDSVSSRSQAPPMSDTAEGDSIGSKRDDLSASARTPPKDIMADLDLEPVSEDDSSLDGCLEPPETANSDVEKEEGEEKDSDKESKISALATFKEDSIKSFNTELSSKAAEEEEEEENASDEGEIKSESEEELREEKYVKEEMDSEEEAEKRQRAATRKPIHQVDFGEAEKRAREARGMFPGDGDRRGWSLTATPAGSYRGGFTSWTASGSTSTAYGSSKTASRYAVHDPSSPIRSKSPSVNFDAESEASSHSRSSVRVRDDVPPPYPIEGVTSGRKYRSPASSSDTAVDHKPVSPPSLVSSLSSRVSRTQSRSHSRSPSSSTRSTSYSSDSATSSRKRKRSKRSKKKRKRREKSRTQDYQSPIPSPHSRHSSVERRISPRKSPDLPGPPAAIPDRDRHLSSGNESISSDELPYFPDEESEVPAAVKPKPKRLGSSSSSVSINSHASKRQRKDSSGSISSSELIYSPTRTLAAKEKDPSDSSSSSSSNKEKKRREKNRKRRRSSSLKSSQSSSDFPPISPVRGSEGAVPFSPHRPSSPVTYPALPDDMSGFQPPLPQEQMDMPPLPPPSPKGFPPSPAPVENPLSEEEEGECLSSPERSEWSDPLSKRRVEAGQKAVYPGFSGVNRQAEISESGLVISGAFQKSGTKSAECRVGFDGNRKSLAIQSSASISIQDARNLPGTRREAMKCKTEDSTIETSDVNSSKESLSERKGRSQSEDSRGVETRSVVDTPKPFSPPSSPPVPSSPPPIPSSPPMIPSSPPSTPPPIPSSPPSAPAQIPSSPPQIPSSPPQIPSSPPQIPSSPPQIPSSPPQIPSSPPQIPSSPLPIPSSPPQIPSSPPQIPSSPPSAPAQIPSSPPKIPSSPPSAPAQIPSSPPSAPAQIPSSPPQIPSSPPKIPSSPPSAPAQIPSSPPQIPSSPPQIPSSPPQIPSSPPQIPSSPPQIPSSPPQIPSSPPEIPSSPPQIPSSPPEIPSSPLPIPSSPPAPITSSPSLPIPSSPPTQMSSSPSMPQPIPSSPPPPIPSSPSLRIPSSPPPPSFDKGERVSTQPLKDSTSTTNDDVIPAMACLTPLAPPDKSSSQEKLSSIGSIASASVEERMESHEAVVASDASMSPAGASDTTGQTAQPESSVIIDTVDPVVFEKLSEADDSVSKSRKRCAEESDNSPGESQMTGSSPKRLKHSDD